MYIRVDEWGTRLYYIEGKKIIRIPLSYSKMEVQIRYGARYLGWLREGVIWCSKWWYKVEGGTRLAGDTLIVVAQTKGA